MGVAVGAGEGGDRVSMVLRRCRESAVRLRRQAVWELLVAGAADMAIQQLVALRASHPATAGQPSPSRLIGSAHTAASRLTGDGGKGADDDTRHDAEGCAVWEEVVGRTVEDACMVTAVRQRIQLTPDWLTNPGALQTQQRDLEQLPSAVWQLVTAIEESSWQQQRAGLPEAGPGAPLRLQAGWVLELAEGECAMALRIDCLVALRLSATPGAASKQHAPQDPEPDHGDAAADGPYSALIRQDTDPLEANLDAGVGGGSMEEFKRGDGAAAFDEIISWAEALAAGAVQHLDCHHSRRAQAASSAPLLVRIAERLSAAADAVESSGLRHALARARRPVHDHVRRQQQQQLLVAEEQVTQALLLASYLALFRALWSTRDPLALHLLLAEPAHVRQCDARSAGGIVSWFVRRALVRLGTHPSFSWAKTWAQSLASESVSSRHLVTNPGLAALRGGPASAQAAAVGYGASGRRAAGDAANADGEQLASLALESVLLGQVTGVLRAALSQSAEMMSAAEEDSSCTVIYSLRDSLEHTARRLSHVSERCAVQVTVRNGFDVAAKALEAQLTLTPTAPTTTTAATTPQRHGAAQPLAPPPPLLNDATLQLLQALVGSEERLLWEARSRYV